MTTDEKEVFDLINNQRTQNGLSALKLDTETLRVARIKAQDMVDNNYFSHNSPTYGSPFQMLNSFKISYNFSHEDLRGNLITTQMKNDGVTYRAWGENIAYIGGVSDANALAEQFMTNWMNSSGHKANILNSSFNYTGIGVVKSSKYGKVYVQMFLGK